MRINGFSGLDIDSMVNSLMTAKRIPLDKLNQQKTILQWTRDSYREVNSKIVDFRNNKLWKYGNSTEMNTQKAMVTGNVEAVKAEATAKANGIPMTISVTQLATRTSMETNGVAGKNVTSTTTLGDLQAIKNNEAITEGNYKDNSYSMKINGESFTFYGSTSISSVISTINSNSKAGAVAAFDELTGKLVISSKAYGKEGKLDGIDAAADNTVLDLFGGTGADPVKAGKGSIAFINGTMVERDSNTYTINGTELTLLATTVNQTDPTVDPSGSVDNKPASIKTQTDPQKALDTIKAFIEDYNSLLGLINSKVSEEKYRGFSPLSDEQKREMKEKDIELWEEKARSGLLKNDEILKSTMSSMRMIITSNLGDLSKIGITTGQYFENGKIKLDEEKLKKAINEDPQRIMEIFQGTSSSPDSGIFDKLYNEMNVTLDKLVEKAGTNKYSTDANSTYKTESAMGKMLKDYTKRIEDMTSRLSRAEAAYYKQFTAMETAMSKYESQSSSIANFFK